jgi:hypothetical protein
MKHYATVLIPIHGNACGGQYCGHVVKPYYSTWKVIVSQYADGTMKISKPKITHWNLTREEALRKCEISQSHGGLALSSGVFDGEGMSQSQFYDNVVNNAEWAINYLSLPSL